MNILFKHIKLYIFKINVCSHVTNQIEEQNWCLNITVLQQITQICNISLKASKYVHVNTVKNVLLNVYDIIVIQ